MSVRRCGSSATSSSRPPAANVLATRAARSSDRVVTGLHPLAAAIVAAAEEQGIALRDVEDFVTMPGQGVRGRCGRRTLLLGNQALLEASGVDLADLAQRARPLRAQGQTVMFLAVGGLPAGLVTVSDPIKPSTQEAASALHHEGVRIVLLTGDSRGTAETLGQNVDVDELHADMVPEQKLAFVADLRARGHVVAVAGDGVHDASVLACADLAIAMGTGTDVAVHDAPLTMVQGDLRAIARARVLSRVTLRNVRQNVAFALAYNAGAVAFAALAPFAIARLAPSPAMAVAAMTAAAMAVLGNALRLRRVA